MTIYERLTTVFRQEFELPATAAIDGLSYQTYPGWDSIAHMRLVAAVESEFSVLLETGQILDFSSFAKGLGILKAHGVADA